MFTANALPVLQKWGVEEKMIYDVFQRIVSLWKISSNSEATFKDKQSFLREKKMLTLKKERREEREASLFHLFSLHPFAICWDTWVSFCGTARKLRMKLPCFFPQHEQS